MRLILGAFVLIAAISVGLGAYEKSIQPEEWVESYIEIEESDYVIEFQFETLVTATIYHPVEEQCDSDPDVVASGKRINILEASRHRWIAVSRDLHARWGGPLEFGDVVHLDGADYLSGFYIVEDIMNPRWTNRVDILRTPGSPDEAFESVRLTLY